MPKGNNRDARPEGGLKYGAQGVGVVLFLAAIICAVSLVTYDASDATAFGATGQPFHNKLNFVGAWLSFRLFDILGGAAFALPVFLAQWGVYQFRGGVTLTRLARLVVFLLAVFLAAAFLGLTVPGDDDVAVAAAVARGGAVGLMLRDAVSFVIGRWFGMLFVALGGVVAGAWAVAAVSPKKLWNGTAAAVRWLASGVGPAFRRGRGDAEPEAGDGRDAAPPELAEDEGFPGAALDEPSPAAAPRGGRKAREPKDEPLPPPRPRGPYRLPPLELLAPPAPPSEEVSQEYLNECKKKLEAALESYRVDGRVREIRRGPRVSRFEVELAPGQKFGAMKSLEEDLARNIAVPGVTVTSVASRGAVAVDVPNPTAARVGLRELIGTNTFVKEAARAKLAFAAGRRHDGQLLVADLAKMPHLLVAGATGSGKSIFLNSVVMSFLMTATPDEVQFLIVDPKRVDLTAFARVPHRHYAELIVTELEEAVAALKAVVRRMEGRYKLLAAVGARNIESYNRLFGTPEGRAQLEERVAAETDEETGKPLPYIVVIVDELNDLMTRERARKVEDQLVRLAQMARAVGIHLVVATQRPSVDVITGVIKANFPSRIAFKVSSQVDSRTIMDRGGAEHLLPEGDMLFLPAGASEPERVQGVYVGDDEIARVVDFWAKQQPPAGLASIHDFEPEPERGEAAYVNEEDELYDDAAALVVSSHMASVSMLQRRFRIGFARAGRLIDLLERRSVVGPGEGSKPRKVLVKSLDELRKLSAADSDESGY